MDSSSAEIAILQWIAAAGAIVAALSVEEISAKLLATARELPSGQDRHNALRQIGRFRAQIAALQGADSQPAKAELTAKPKG